MRQGSTLCQRARLADSVVLELLLLTLLLLVLLGRPSKRKVTLSLPARP